MLRYNKGLQQRQSLSAIVTYLAFDAVAMYNPEAAKPATVDTAAVTPTRAHT